MDRRAHLLAILTVGTVMAQPQPPSIPIIPAPNPVVSGMVPNRPGNIPGPAQPGTSVRGRTAAQTRSNQNDAAANCINMGRDVVSRCFQSNGGFQMQYVLAILSNGTQGPLPRNAQQMTSNMCSSQGTIIACIFSGISNLRNTQQCPTLPEYIRLEQETVSLVSNLQQICGKGPLPAPDVCHRSLFQNLRNCYTKAGISPDIFSPNYTTVTRAAGPSHVIGSVIGSDPKTAAKFCRGWFSPKMKRVKNQLFGCMKQTVEKCPGALELLALSGYDQEALRKGIDVLCHDVDVYMDGMRCFKNRSPENLRCYNTLLEKVTDLSADQVRLNLPTSQYNARYCQLRVQHLDCDLAVWKKQCTLDVVGLKNEFECNLLPATCKNDPTTQKRLQRTCAIEGFQRHLRSGSSRSFSVASVTVTLVSMAVVLLVL